MKQVTIIAVIILMLMPTIVSAHTHLESSTPESGQVVTDELNEIVLIFGGEIESLSTMKLMKDGQEVSLARVEPQGTKMVGTPEAPLENGSYVVEWKIVGEDGHAITGEIPFSMAVEQAVEEPVKEEAETVEPDKSADTDENKEDTVNQEAGSNEQSGSNLTKVVIPVVIVLLLGIGLMMLFRRKK